MKKTLLYLVCSIILSTSVWAQNPSAPLFRETLMHNAATGTGNGTDRYVLEGGGTCGAASSATEVGYQGGGWF